MIAEPQIQKVNPLIGIDPRHATLHRRAVRAYQRGDAQRWVACLCAARIIGHYDPGAALALADDLSLSLSQVSNLAAAGRMYRSLRGFAIACKLWRRILTPGHFAAMWKLMEKYGLASYEAAGYLAEAAEYHSSVAAMHSAVDGLHGGGKPKPRQWLATMVKSEHTRNGRWFHLLASGDESDPPDGAALRIVEVIE